MNFNVEDLKKHIPFYLTAADQTALVAELKAFSAGTTPNYFLSDYHNEYKLNMLQGDGWPGFQLRLFDSGERKSVRGMVLSNSCDVDPTNKREVSTRVVFTPLVKLTTYRELLDASEIGAEKVEAKIISIKAQKTTNIFYLPNSGPLSQDYIVRLDELYSMPTSAHVGAEKWFTLSRMGFYLFVLKLSVHFCRLQENVSRSV